jgi:hypothetical protein
VYAAAVAVAAAYKSAKTVINALTSMYTFSLFQFFLG